MGMVISPFQDHAGFNAAQLAYDRRAAERGTFSTGSTKLAQAMSLVAIEDGESNGFPDPSQQLLQSQDLMMTQPSQPQYHLSSQSYLQRDLSGRMSKRIAVDIPPVPSQEMICSQSDLATPVEQQFLMGYIPVAGETVHTSTTEEFVSRSPAPSPIRFQKRPRGILHLTAECDSECTSQQSGSQNRSQDEPSSCSKATSSAPAATTTTAPSGGSKRPPIPRSAKHRHEPPVIRNPYINPIKADAFAPSVEDHLYHGPISAHEQPHKVSRLSWDYKIDGGELGHGHYSTVYKAVHRQSGKMYAIKRNKKPIQSVADKNTWLTEIQALAHLEGHPNVVKYYDSWAEPAYDSHVGGENIFIKLELCGEPLANALARKTALKEPELLCIMRHVAAGLKHVHDMGLAHMDIKPDNIYKGGIGAGSLSSSSSNGRGSGTAAAAAGTQETYKLGDFGLATPKDGSGRFMEGDARYLAPELLKTELHDQLDKADMFALGAMIYELATASPLPTGGERYHDLRNGKLTMIPHVSMKLQALIKKLMAQEPKSRPTADDLLRHALLNTATLKLTRSHSSSQGGSQGF